MTGDDLVTHGRVVTRARPVLRPLCELRRRRDWVLVGTLRGALLGGLLPATYGVVFVVLRTWQSTTEPAYEGQTSVSYPNTPGGAWGYAVVTVMYIGLLLAIASGGAAAVGLVAGATIGIACAVVDGVSGRRVPPCTTATAVIAAVTAVTYPWLAGTTLRDLDPDLWVFLVAVPMGLGLLSLVALPLRRSPT